MSRCFKMPDIAADGSLLSNAELEFFKRQGFVVKKRLLGAAKLEEVMRLIWQEIESIPPEGQILRSKPDTWVDPAWSSAVTPFRGPHKGRAPVDRHRGQRELKLHGLGAAPALLELLPQDPSVCGIARLLLGPQLREVCRARGVYCIFPGKDGMEALGPHVDRSAQQLNVCAYLEDVPPRCGGFTVWPGSHRLLYQTMELENNFSPAPEAFGQGLRRCLEAVVPVELCGEAGDVIFWHGRALRSAGVHTSAETIRFAVFADFQLEAAEGDSGLLAAEEEEELSGQHEWFKDTRLYREDRPPCREDMWRHWAACSDQLPAAEDPEPAQEQTPGG